MSFRPTRAFLLLASATLLFLAPISPAAWPAAAVTAAGQRPAAEADTYVSPATLAPNDEPLGDPASPPPSSNKPPVIRNLKYTAEGTTITFTGKVEDENPGGLTVRFGGPSSMGNQTTMTDASGNFSHTVNMGGQTGEVWAKTTDAEGLESPYAYVNVY